VASTPCTPAGLCYEEAGPCLHTCLWVDPSLYANATAFATDVLAIYTRLYVINPLLPELTLAKSMYSLVS